MMIVVVVVVEIHVETVALLEEMKQEVTPVNSAGHVSIMSSEVNSPV
jgi:hypothetical protein